MPRTRTIKPEFLDDEKLGSVSRDARLTFIGLLINSDDYGVVKGNPIWLKSKIFPYDDISLEFFLGWLKELEKITVILPFSKNGERFYYIRNFKKHQTINRPSQQRNPAPPEDILNTLSTHGALIEDSVSTHGVLIDETETETETETEYKLDHHNASADASASVRHATRPDGSPAFGGCGDSGDNGKGNGTGKKNRKPSRTSMDYPQDFLEFWAAYPRKVGKNAALRRWQALRKAGALPNLTTLLEALQWQKTQDSWQEDGGKYIPHPATWLNAGRWADEPPTIDEIEETDPEYLKKLADPNCPICHGEGWEPLRENGNHWFKPCLCTKGKRDEIISKSRIGKMPRGRYPPDASYS